MPSFEIPTVLSYQFVRTILALLILLLHYFLTLIVDLFFTLIFFPLSLDILLYLSYSNLFLKKNLKCIYYFLHDNTSLHFFLWIVCLLIFFKKYTSISWKILWPFRKTQESSYWFNEPFEFRWEIQLICETRNVIPHQRPLLSRQFHWKCVSLPLVEGCPSFNVGYSLIVYHVG